MVFIMRNGSKTGSNHDIEQRKEIQVEVSLKLPEGLLKRVYLFDIDDKIWYAKLRVINAIAKGVKDVLNYGFYELPCNGRSGKFLDEERTLRDYPQRKSPAELEFKYKRRVYKSLQYDGKTLQKVHTKSNLKKLMESVSLNLVSQVSKWTEKGLDPNFQDDKTGETPLTVAINGDDREDLILALVSGGAHLDYRSGDSLTPLHKAAIAGKAKSIKILLDLGSSPNMKDSKGLTPLYYTVLNGGDAYCCQLLLDEHSDMGITDHQGMQEIHHACKNGLVQHLEHLIFYGADINATTNSGNTPLHITALSNQEDCARVLLFRGAKRDKLNYANQSTYEVAAVAGNKELADFIRTFTDGQIVKISEKPTYSTRRRKTVQKPRASSLFAQSSSDPSTKSDSSLPPSPRSSSGSHRSSTADTISLEENGQMSDRVERSMSVCSTTSDSSYCSESEILEQSVDESRSSAQKNRSRDMDYPSRKMAPPVKMVSGAATMRKRLYANVHGRRYVAVRDYIPCMGGELEVEKGDIVEVLYVGEKGFWEGRIDNRTGWFPSSCVEELKTDKGRAKTLFGRPPSLSSLLSKSETQGPVATLPDDRFIQPARTVILNRGKKGFGFQMRGANCQTPRLHFKPTKEFPALQYIGEVEPNGEADSKGVKMHDFILEVNGEDVATATHSHVVNLIKRSGKTVKLKIVTMTANKINGVDSTDSGYNSLAYNSLRGNRVPPPLPQRDPSTTLTLGRMRAHSAHSRPSLFEASLGGSNEEPANFQMDSVITVSKDSRWYTLQRRKPGTSDSRSAAQFKFNGAGKSRPRNDNPPLYSSQRSKSMQNIAGMQPSSYDTMTGKRMVKTAVPFAFPQVPERYSRSTSQDVDPLSKRMDLHSHSDPNLDVPKLQRSRSMNDQHNQTEYGVDLSATNFGSGDIVNRETTIVATPISATENDQESGPNAFVTPVCDSIDIGSNMNNGITRERKHSLGSKTSEPFNLTNALRKAVDARNERISEQRPFGNAAEVHANGRKSSAPVTVRKRTNTTDRFRTDMISQINNTELRGDETEPYAPHRTAALPKRESYSTLDRSYSNESVNLRPSSNSQKSVERPKSALEIRGTSHKTSKPQVASKSVITPPAPPPAPPLAPPAATPVEKSPKPVKPANEIFKGKKVDVPLTAVKQGLITVDALKAKKGKLKAVEKTNPETPKTAKSIHNLVGKLASHGGKTAPMFGGNQHSNMLAKAVAARAARLANEAHESEHSESPSSWEDESESPNIPFSTNPPKQRAATPKKTPPPVPPKKKSPVPGHRPLLSKTELDSPTRRKLYPPYINELSPDKLSLFSTEEDRTMMLFDDILRQEVESENWSLSSWNSSDSSTAADVIAPPPFPGNGYDERKSSVGSAARTWYEYSSGSPSEDSLNASTERISQVRPSLSQELKNTEGSFNFDNEKNADERRRRFSNGSENATFNGKLYGQANTNPSSEGIQLNPIVQAFSQPNLASKDAGDENLKDSNNSARQPSQSDKDTYKHLETQQPGQQQKGEETKADLKSDRNLSSSTSENENDDGLVEQTFITSTGVQIKLRLQPKRKLPASEVDSRSSGETSPEQLITNTPNALNKDRPSNLSVANTSDSSSMDNSNGISITNTPNTVNKAYPNGVSLTSNSDTLNTVHQGTNCADFKLPPPPLEFDEETFNEVPLPPLPPPPEFCPVDDDSGDFSPLPAPPMDFCDTDSYHSSIIDAPTAFDLPTKGSSFQDKPLLEWSCIDVCDWLESLNLSQYQNTFRENDIQGAHLPELTRVELQELGIKSLGHRMTMENSIAKYCHPMESNC